MRTILQDVDSVLASKWYRLTWAPFHKTDAQKIKLERGSKTAPPKRRPLAGDPWARSFIEAIRVGLEWEAPAPQPPTPGTKIPAPFNGQGLVLLEPRGGTEDIAAAKAAGFTYLLLNIAFVSGGSWEIQRGRAKALGMPCIPWRRVLNADHSREIERKADEWGAPAAAHNLEAEAVTTYPPAQLAAVCREFKSRPRAVITEPWMQNGAGWAALADWVAMPEAFQNADTRWLPAVVTDHAKAEGMPWAVPLFGWGVWSDAATLVPPATYLTEWKGPFAVYAGDGKEPEYLKWKRA